MPYKVEEEDRDLQLDLSSAPELSDLRLLLEEQLPSSKFSIFEDPDHIIVLKKNWLDRILFRDVPAHAFHERVIVFKAVRYP